MPCQISDIWTAFKNVKFMTFGLRLRNLRGRSLSSFEHAWLEILERDCSLSSFAYAWLEFLDRDCSLSSFAHAWHEILDRDCSLSSFAYAWHEILERDQSLFNFTNIQLPSFEKRNFSIQHFINCKELN